MTPHISDGLAGDDLLIAFVLIADSFAGDTAHPPQVRHRRPQLSVTTSRAIIGGISDRSEISRRSLIWSSLIWSSLIWSSLILSSSRAIIGGEYFSDGLHGDDPAVAITDTVITDTVITHTAITDKVIT
jgi:hypothetical protein